ncbi:glycosyltransferase family 2 protein [Frateuria aurantia]
MMSTPPYALIIPTRNSADHLPRLLPALRQQTAAPAELLIMDTASTDGSAEQWRDFGARVVAVQPGQFNHGGTRRLASSLVRADYLIYMTQDAVPATADALQRLLAALLEDERIGVAYGRQRPHPGASLLAAHARAFNYPPEDQLRWLADAPRFGIKTCFNSDAFAAYRRRALEQVGGFPEHVIGTEDAYVAARMLMAGMAVRYCASAEVFHSHDYRISEEFRRYFDIGVFYHQQSWIGETFGQAGGEGLRYVRSECRYLWQQRRPQLIPAALLRDAAKWLGYRLGAKATRLPVALKRRISMFPPFWNGSP